MANVLRGFNALDRRDDRAARQLAQGALLGPPGTAQDLGGLIVGAADRRLGRHREALRRLKPLIHKMIDPFATALLDEELVRAALGTGRHREAVGFMAVWLRETDPASRRAVAREVEQLLGQIPTEQLFRSISALSAGDESEADEEITRLIAARLAVAAREASDADLARALLERFGGLLGGQGEAVARLAADTGRARVTARTLGLMLSLRSPVHRRRSADVAAGMAFGLGMPGSGARLVSRDGGSSDGEALTALRDLAADGAAVIVAGLDQHVVAATVEFALSEQLPVILLSDGAERGVRTSPYLLRLGEPRSASAELLASALGKAGVKRIVGFGAEPPTAGASGAAGGSAAPAGVVRDDAVGTVGELSCPAQLNVEQLRSLRADGFLVRDGAACGFELLQHARAVRASLGVGLGVPQLAGRLPTSAHVLSAGVFPVQPKTPDPALDKWLATGRGSPSWWTALGRDAAVLGWKAVERLEGAATEDPKEVRARRAEAATGLAAASVGLWTSSARGFGPDGRVLRTVVVRRGAGGRDAGR